MSLDPRFSITNAAAAALTRIERARGFLDAARLSEEWVASMRSRAFVLEAHHTTHIKRPRCPGVNRRTLQRDLKGLVNRALLKTEGATSRLQYAVGKALT